MDALEQQLRSGTRSWKAIIGAGVTTALLFLSITSSGIVVNSPRKRELPQLSYANVPPPPPPPMKDKTTPPLTSSLAEEFKFDPTAASPVPEVPLEFLDIRLDPHVDPAVAIGLDMTQRFEVSKPEAFDTTVVFERNQVDELPVWLYGPMPNLPSSLQRTDFDVQVLYILSDKGRPERIYVLDSTAPAANEAIKDAMRKWVFQPARKDGKAVRQWVQQAITYRPSSKSPFSI